MADASTVDLSEDRSGTLRAYAIGVTVLTFLAISARFLGRLLIERGNRFWWDDWAALASVPTIVVLNAIILSELDVGLGRHMDSISEEDLGVFLKLFYASYFSYDLALWATKTAAILFLSRVFPQRANGPWFNFALWGTHGINTAWLIGTVFGTLFFCDPIEKNWKPEVEGRCGDVPTLMLGSAVSSVIIDLIILLLPLPKIWGLKLDMAKRSGLVGVFVVGYLVIVVSIGRLVTLLNTGDETETDLSWAVVPAMFWFLMEAPITLLCICLPACLPILRRLFSRWVSPMVTRATDYISGTRSRSGPSAARSQAGKFPSSGGDDPEAINISSYPVRGNNKHKSSSSAGIRALGSTFNGGRESLDSDGSNREILGWGKWHAQAQAKAAGPSVSASASTSTRTDVPDWTIRVDKDVSVQTNSNW